jgi:CDP-diacylglycerol--serine O-phosphatidyltransferase
MESPFPPFDPDGARLGRGERLRGLPLRAILPSLLTLLAIAAGLTSIRFAVEGRIAAAVAAIVFAAFLDGIDGRVARLLKSSSRFGAELDSLADFVNFGVAPAMLVYFTLMHGVAAGGWVAALVFAISACLRLARFNTQLDQPNRPLWQASFFTGVPAPAGAMLALAPVYVHLLGLDPSPTFGTLSGAYLVAVGLLMVSRLPTWSGKEATRQVPRDLVLPLLIALVAFVALLASYPAQTLLACIGAYFACLPLGYRDWKRREAAALAAAAAPQSAEPPGVAPLGN